MRNFTGTDWDLLEIHREIMRNELRVWLLRSLLSEGLATRDIYHFTLNQAKLCTVDRGPDQLTMKAAMNVKIEDVRNAIRSGHRRKKMVKNNILNELEGRRAILKNRINKINKSLGKERNDITTKYKNKIEHYLKVQKPNLQVKVEQKPKNDSPTVPPGKLGEYCDLSIFGNVGELPKPEKSLGPFICDSSIKLTTAERELLSKDPKFCIGFEPDKNSFQVEIQRTLSKHRINETKQELSNKALREGVKTCRLDHGELGPDVTENLKKDRLHEIFEDQKNRYIYNPIDMSICFNKRSASDYKMNKSIKLPKPLSNDQEFQCEIKKREYERAFQKYKSIEGKRKATDKGGKNEPINLNGVEIGALKSIKERIKTGEICITSTDKSSRFALLTKEQYLKAGSEHTKKDKKISWDKVKYLQTQVNAHMWWLSKIVGYSKDKNEARMSRNIQGVNMEVPQLILLVKDHKQWCPESGVPVPTRPVASGNRGINSHLSEWISEIMEPVALSMESAEVCSTEEVLAKIDHLNDCIDKGQLNQLDPLSNVSLFTDLEYKPGLVEDSTVGKSNELFQFTASNDTESLINLNATYSSDDSDNHDDGLLTHDKSDAELAEETLFVLAMEAANERKKGDHLLAHDERDKSDAEIAEETLFVLALEAANERKEGGIVNDLTQNSEE